MEYIDFTVECIPKTASMLRESNMLFTERRFHYRDDIWLRKFIQLTNDLGLCLDSTACRRAMCAIEMNLFRCWGLLNYSMQLPQIDFPSAPFQVHKFSEPILYYTAGWIVGSLSRAKLAVRQADKREANLMKGMAKAHSLTEEQAKDQDLPTRVIERKEMKNLKRPSRAFFDFICHLEAIYMQNLTVAMMLAFSGGDLLSQIAGAISRNNEVRDDFKALIPPLKEGTTAMTAGELCRMLGYVLKKYKRMRGRWFVKAVAGQTCKGAVAKMPTRAKVAANAEAANCGSKAKEEATSSDDVMSLGEEALGKMYLNAEANVSSMEDGSDDDSDDEKDL